MLLVVVLLHEQIGVGGEEGVRRLLGRDHRDDVAVLGAEPAEKVEHLAGLADGLTDVVKSIGELLEMAGVAGDVHVALNEVAELGLQVHGAVKLIVMELILDGGPDEVGGGLGYTDDGEDLFGRRSCRAS